MIIVCRTTTLHKQCSALWKIQKTNKQPSESLMESQDWLQETQKGGVYEGGAKRQSLRIHITRDWFLKLHEKV